MINKIASYCLLAHLLVFSTQSMQSQNAKLLDNNTLDTVVNLNELVVRYKKPPYKRRGNPAVELIRKTIEHKNDNRVENNEDFSAKLYEKLILSLDYSEKDPLLRHIPAAKNYVDTSSFSGHPILNLSIKETLSDYYSTLEPKTEKTIITATHHEGLDKSFDINETLTANINEILRNVDICDNDIAILMNRFVSPLSSLLGISYYHYDIVDTLEYAGEQCVNVAFVPANPQSYGLIGYLYIALDGSYSVRKATMNVSRNINLNWVDKIRIEQSFARTDSGHLFLREDITDIAFNPIDNTPRLYAHKIRRFDEYALQSIEQQPDSAPFQSGAFPRPIPLTEKEFQIGAMLSDLHARPLYRIGLKVMEILALNYIPTTIDNRRSRFDFGPMHATFASNEIEGLRIRAGGTTTARLHPHLFVGGYVAYGSNDQKWKYQTKLTYSFNDRKNHENEIPVNNLSVLYAFDVYFPGQNFLIDKDNLFSFNIRNSGTVMQYVRRTVWQYEKEWMNHFSITVSANHWRSQSVGNLQYSLLSSQGHLTPVPALTQSEIGLSLRYAPNEKPFNSREGRSSPFNFSKDALILNLSHQIGFKGVMGGDYGGHHTEMSLQKRIWLSSFGYIDAFVHAGKVWNKVPFPLLTLPPTNHTVTITSQSFMMMNAMEFLSDEYVSFFITYYLKGLIFNHIPVIHKLKLREVVSLNGVYGNLSDKNNPAFNPSGLFQFPVESRIYGRKPYLEASAGLENILKILRIDYFWRLTYLDAPTTQKSGVRIAFRFQF